MKEVNEILDISFEMIVVIQGEYVGSWISGSEIQKSSLGRIYKFGSCEYIDGTSKSPQWGKKKIEKIVGSHHLLQMLLVMVNKIRNENWPLDLPTWRS